MALGMVCDRPVCDWRFPAVVGVDAACFQQVVQVFQWSPSRCQFWSLACARLCSRVSSTGHVIGKLERPLARPRREAQEAIQHARGWPRCHAQPRSRRSDDPNLDSRADQDKTNTRYCRKGGTPWQLMSSSLKARRTVSRSKFLLALLSLSRRRGTALHFDP